MVLSEMWFMEGYIDFELQKYRLLAYLQNVKEYFDKNRLYPQLADLVFHYNNLLSFKANKRLLNEHFPKKMIGLDVAKMEAVYERMLADDEVMSELEQIAEYALEQITVTLREGAERYEEVEHHMLLSPIGIMPLYNKEGYVFCCAGQDNTVAIYNYNVTLFEHKDARFKGIRMKYIESASKTVINTYEQIKIDMVRRYRVLPNPAVYLVTYPERIPIEETLLPIAKRQLIKKIDGDTGNYVGL